MSEMGASDPSKLQLKKELTQIRKASRVLRDPGTTSSWKSPLHSARSVSTPVGLPGSSSTNWKNNSLFDTQSLRKHRNTKLDSNANGKTKRVFLYNWKNQKSSSEKSALARNAEEDDGDDKSSWNQDTVDDSLSDERNDEDSKSDSYAGDTRFSSAMFGCRDANLVSLGTHKIKRSSGTTKKCKRKGSHHSDVFSRYQEKKLVLDRHSLNNRGSSKGHRRDDSVDQSDDTENYSHSDDSRKILRESPLLPKLKHKNWPRSSPRLLKATRKEDSSCTYSTPALSASSYRKYANRNPSTVESWDATTASMNDRDDEVGDHFDLPGRQGCGIPCYWSRRTPKHRASCGSCCSPSLSDTLRRKGSSILCGSQSMYPRRRCSSSVSDKRRVASRSAQGVLPLLTNNGEGRGSSIETGNSDDDLSTNYAELDLEALSRLDGRRWSTSCRSRSHDGLEIVALNGTEEESTPENIRSLTQKYRPMFFDELIGQNIVVQSLINSVSRGRIAPVYLFQGPRGTGKTSTARIFAGALNCTATNETKPCGFCRECTNIMSGKSIDLCEVDGSNKKAINKIRYLLKNLSAAVSSGSSKYKIFVIDECHLLPSKTWISFLKFLEDPPQRVVLIFITTDLDNVPRAIQSRCQKFLFNKVRDVDIVAKLKKISADENLDVELEALELIALNADGSLRDAETMLDQLSLLGKRITASLVNELVGVVSDEKLLELLELAMSLDTAETVKRARELMDSGVDPIVLMSQLASLIMDIIAGTYSVGQRSLTEAELERLKHALKLLSDAEKQLRVSSERSTWFTATLLQLGSMPSPDLSQSGSSRRQSSSSTSREASIYKQKLGVQCVPRDSISPVFLHNSAKISSSQQGELLSQNDSYNIKLSSLPVDNVASTASHDNPMFIPTPRNADNLGDIWTKCIEGCHSKTLRQLLRTYGKLLSISEIGGNLIAYVAFGDSDIKSRAERFVSSITNSIEIVLRQNVEVRIILLPDNGVPLNCGNPMDQTETTVGIERHRRIVYSDAVDGLSDLDSHQESLKVAREKSEGNPRVAQDTYQSNIEFHGSKESRHQIPMQRIESIIREQRLETAWLQTAEKGTPGSFSQLKPEKNQVLPQEGIYLEGQIESINSSGFSFQTRDDELNELKLNDEVEALETDRFSKRVDHHLISPSLLHNASLPGSSNKDIGYESGAGSGGCFCWKNTNLEDSKLKARRPRSHKTGFSLFRKSGKAKKPKGGIQKQS